MKTTFGTTKKGTWAYIQKSVRIDGKPTTKDPPRGQARLPLQAGPHPLTLPRRLPRTAAAQAPAKAAGRLVPRGLQGVPPGRRPADRHPPEPALFGQIQGLGYVPMFQRTSLTDQLQELAGVEVNKQIITKAATNAFYRKGKKG